MFSFQDLNTAHFSLIYNLHTCYSGLIFDQLLESQAKVAQIRVDLLAEFEWQLPNHVFDHLT